MNRRGTTLLETMIALVILSLVIVGYLEVFGGTARSARDLEMWGDAIAYAEAGMERVKVASDPLTVVGVEHRSDGFRRETVVRPWESTLWMASVTVYFPNQGGFTLRRIVEAP